MARQRIRCPLLDEGEKCGMYEARPITCRLYGIPTVIGGQAHTCGLSQFEEGKQYPTVKLDNIQRRLYEISFELAQEIKSRYPKLGEVLVPLSMALLTDYNDEYLGIDGGGRNEADGKEA
jgi:Fe-S-cluster containining protein